MEDYLEVEGDMQMGWREKLHKDLDTDKKCGEEEKV
ncbi:Protein of unknown function [Pyronema omphalodes CBS 100304]|uniref:Uncharacterized protein n=1 Tax=Pyronema omphalodes (strain CBS 100304) TaxID=1076935 RepID=U4L144_PYROM|nr:Protein of unknown function [Pyronema omphalodes CBS 100304]